MLGRAALELVRHEGHQGLLGKMEYFDSVVASSPKGRLRNPAGFLVSMIEDDLQIPPSFETSKQRAARIAAQEESNKRTVEENDREYRYAMYVRDAVEHFIQTQLSQEEYQELLEQSRGAFFRKLPHMAHKRFCEELANSSAMLLRSELAKDVRTGILSFEQWLEAQKRNAS